jgi:hypothetical protein
VPRYPDVRARVIGGQIAIGADAFAQISKGAMGSGPDGLGPPLALQPDCHDERRHHVVRRMIVV